MKSDGIPYVVEKMTLRDVPQVAAMEKVVFSLPWSSHAFEYELQFNPMAYFAVVRPRAAESNEGANQTGELGQSLREARHALLPVLGYGGFWHVVDEAHICTLAVHPGWRGRGLGELLLVHLIEQATARNAAVVTLEVRTSNLVAQQLYRKYGFAVAGLRKGYYSDNQEDALIMTTDLISSANYQSHFQALRTALYRKLSSQLTPSQS